MELKYIWIKEYKNLKNIGFNFNAANKESFEYLNDELIISEKECAIPTNFFNENIKELTAIVGENGSGKTNFSEFLNCNLGHVGNGGLSVNFYSEGILIIDNLIFIQEKLIIKNSKNLKELGFKIIPFENAPLDKGPGEFHWSEMERNKYVYYSPNFDFRSINWHLGNMYNISTGYLIQNDVYDSAKHITNTGTSYDKKQQTDSLAAFYREEKLRESDLILNYPVIKELIKSIPTKLKVSIDHVSENQLLDFPYNYSKKKDKKTIKREGNIEQLNEIEKRFLGWYNINEFEHKSEARTGCKNYQIPIEKKQESFKTLFIIKFFKLYLRINDVSFPEDFLRKFINDEDYKLKDKSLQSEFEELKTSINDIIKCSIWNDDIVEIMDNSYRSFDEYQMDVYNLFRNLKIDINQGSNRKTIINLIETTKKLLNNNLHFHYEFNHRLSSGEQNLLNFYARFFWVKNEIAIKDKESYVKGERIVIFIDEGEVSLHPEWQRRFFYLAIDYLSKLFSDKEIQLILTTHSPFVLSDLPKENIIFLKKNVDGNAEISNIERDNTFGANIYSLLADSFFMENGTIGEFAKGKIEWVLKILDDKEVEITEDELKKIDFIINNIGEPLIKMQLEALKKKSLNTTEISEMRKKIVALEEQLKKEKE